MIVISHGGAILYTECETREARLCTGVPVPAEGLGRGHCGQRFLEGKGEEGSWWLWPARTPCDFSFSV